MQVGVLVVDDESRFRRVALEVVEATPGFEPLGEAASGEEALVLVADLRPELILLDVRMPVMDGIETARRLTTEHPGGVVVLISIDDQSELPREVECCGAQALIRKQEFGSQALRGLWDAHGPDSRVFGDQACVARSDLPRTLTGQRRSSSARNGTEPDTTVP